MLDSKIFEAEVVYCRNALAVALERAVFTSDDEERERALAVVSELEDRLVRALSTRTPDERMRLLAL